MEFNSQTLLLYLVLAIFIFCYFIATRVWIKVDEQNRESSSKEDQEK